VKLTSLEEYGLRCLVELGRGREGESVTIAEMSRREGISAPNVAKIMRVLRRAGLVTSTRGQAGGYVLARRPADIKVSDILGALEISGRVALLDHGKLRFVGTPGEFKVSQDPLVRAFADRTAAAAAALKIMEDK
jgi:Rrf2 family protein